jgi:hypothetical protein
MSKLPNDCIVSFIFKSAGEEDGLRVTLTLLIHYKNKHHKTQAANQLYWNVHRNMLSKMPEM